MPLLPKPPACEGCPAFTIGKSYVPGRGPDNAATAWIGQGPGEQEAYSGLPFVGPSGKMAENWIMKAGENPDSIYFDNVVRCWLPGNRPPKKAEIEHCYKAYLHPKLSSMTNLTNIVACGVPAMKLLLTKDSGERTAGLILTKELPLP